MQSFWPGSKIIVKKDKRFKSQSFYNSIQKKLKKKFEMEMLNEFEADN